MRLQSMALRLIPVVALATLSGCMTAPAGPPVTTVADALKAKNDTPAVLVGHIVKKLDMTDARNKFKDDTRYEFKDSTGSMFVDIDHDYMPKQEIIGRNTVKIVGEVVKFDGYPYPNEVDAVKKIQVLDEF